MAKRLSILICSIEERKNFLDKLLSVLMDQLVDELEILVETDNREMTTGAKRNILLERATGDYIAFVDDDDMVSDDYVSKILKAIESNPDCCGMEGLTFRENTEKGQKFIHSIKYDEWFRIGNIFLRCPNHLNPVKRELALQVKFPDQCYREDYDYSKRLRPLLKTETIVEGPIYYYL